MPILGLDTISLLLMDDNEPLGIVKEFLHYKQAMTTVQSVSSKDPIIPGSWLVLSCPFQDFSRSLSLPNDRCDLSGLPSTILEALRNRNCQLVIDGSKEGWAFEPLYAERFHEMFIQFDVSPTVATFLTQNRRFASDYISWAAQHRIAEKIQVLCAQYWIPQIARVALNYNKSFEGEQSVTRQKKYVCLNSRPRLHRILLLSSLLQAGVIDDGYVSFGGFTQNGNLQGKPFTIRFETDVLRNMYPALSDEITYLKTAAPLIVDIKHDDQRALTDGFALPLYRDSYFTIVAESDFTNGSIDRVTEKVLKPILGNHPFIIVGNPFSLERVRDMGFKTFAPYIDESYDQITDPALRFKSVTAEIQRLTTLSHQQLKKLCETLHDVTKYNYDYLTNEFVSGWCRSAVLKVESDLNNHIKRNYEA
ncbi:MAG: hypothetical protein RIF37_02835 [Rhodospirillaceae bacterium]